MGLRAKFALALAIAALLPLVAGFIVLQTLGFRHLLATKGRLHEAEAKTLARSLDNAVESQAGHLWSWIAADPAVPDFLAMPRPNRVADLETSEAIEKRWPQLPPDDPLLREILRNPASDSLGRYAEKHPLVAEIFIAGRGGWSRRRRRRATTTSPTRTGGKSGRPCRRVACGPIRCTSTRAPMFSLWTW
jgi:hypothetical protein